MQILLSLSAAVEFEPKQRIAVKVGKTYLLARITEVKRKYVQIVFDDGDSGQFDKVADARDVRIIPKTVKKNKGTLTLAEVRELTSEVKPEIVKVTKEVKSRVVQQVPRRISIALTKADVKSIKAEPYVEPAIKQELVDVRFKYNVPSGQHSTLRSALKEHDDKIIHPIDLIRGMVVQVPVNTQLITVMLIEYHENTKKWAALGLRENTKIIYVPANQLFTHKAPLTKIEKLWEGKYMRRLEEAEA